MRKYVIGAAVLVVALATAAIALAVTQRTYVQTFGTKDFKTGTVKPPVTKPGKPAGTYFKEHSEDPSDTSHNKVPKQDKFVDDYFPPGAKIDQSVPKSCTATDDEIQHAPNGACPGKSKVGTGAAIVRASTSSPTGDLPASITAFNCQKSCAPSTADSSIKQKNQFIFLVDIPGQTVILRGNVLKAGNVYSLHVPVPINCTLNPGKPNCGGAPDVRIVEFELTINKVTKQVTKGKGHNKHKVTKSLITTPKTCPSSKNWIFTIKFVGRDGKTDTKTSKSPCKS